MHVVMAAGRPRCLVVATGLTAALWGAAAVLVGTIPAGRPATPDQALVQICTGGLVLALGWAWVQAVAGVADAWRGAAPAMAHRGVRRLALAACGAALVGAVTAPAHAEPGRPGPHVLSGLPMPDRAEGPAHPRRPGHPDHPDHLPGRVVVVRPGDSLWRIAERDLPPRAGAARITERWHALYRRNRSVVGADPDLIRPGQVLVLTQEKP